ncbi:MAG: 23S rRNA (pseudouridine(1915)-N(3))-methyltransferase RlmH [Synergistaceae bacterium]|jgi:23S rRNA (pseudouridine1915-N3)-methyltransferase|nr:23S rRNA (pseudouridine(1915)-N(3))-methyltransferase RlmH [Synergistaceae bacterium]
MKIVVLVVGRLKDERVASMAGEYLGRIRPGAVSVERVPDARGASPGKRVEREGQDILKRLHPRDRLILLREDGRECDSPAFAALLSREMEAAAGKVVLAIGGPWGFSEAVRRRANDGLSLSRMTLTHEMCFLFLTEQLYRAFSILAGSSYHHSGSPSPPASRPRAAGEGRGPRP